MDGHQLEIEVFLFCPFFSTFAYKRSKKTSPIVTDNEVEVIKEKLRKKKKAKLAFDQKKVRCKKEKKHDKEKK